jgi:pimeloyl-ACP methyl ester carboxylesterase
MPSSRAALEKFPVHPVHARREARFRPVRDFVAASMPMTRVVDAEAGHGVDIQAARTFNAVVADFLTLHGIAEHGVRTPETRQH